MSVDTTAEAVERLASDAYGVSLAHKARSTCCGERDECGNCAAPACHFGNVMRCLQGAAATLRALLAERDAAEFAKAEAEALQQAQRERLTKERDAARAEAARMRGWLEAAVSTGALEHGGFADNIRAALAGEPQR